MIALFVLAILVLHLDPARKILTNDQESIKKEVLAPFDYGGFYADAAFLHRF